MERQNHCLNCGSLFTGKFCSSCGQKVPKRIIWKMLAHEIPHSFFHIDSQIMTNFRMMLTRPGEMLNDFIGGKRKKYFPPVIFRLLLLVSFYWLTTMIPILTSIQF
jgi:hypothetical protein